jgi:hypothetical protein
MRRLLPLLALLAACSSDASPTTPDAAPAVDGPPLSTATELHCPAPGALPFAVTSGFVKPNNATLVMDNPRNKDEASDTLGSPSGIVASVTASIYLPDDQAPTTAGIAYHGVKARTMPPTGLSSTPIVGEKVSVWTYDPNAKAWQALGSATTGQDGDYDVPAQGNAIANGQPIYAVLEADGSCAEHHNYLLPAATNVVVFDIDGTLTLSDGELLTELSDPTYVPKLMGAADKLTQAWAAKNYTVVYLTARTHNLRAETRGWLTDLGFPPGPLVTENGGKADVYKTLWLNRMIQTFGWTVVAAYGNADTDITAYNNAGIPKDHTFIVGPLAGMNGTQAIANMDFTDHIATFVAAQPANP